MGFFKGLSKTYLIGVNVITLLAGLAVTGFSAYLLVEYSDLHGDWGYSMRAAYLGLASGVLTTLLSLIGCLGASKQNKCILCFYTFFMTLMVIVLAAGGIAGLVFLGKMDFGKSAKAGKVEAGIDTTIMNYEMNVFNACGCTNLAPECGEDTDKYCWSKDLVTDGPKLGHTTCTALSKVYWTDDEGDKQYLISGLNSSTPVCGGCVGKDTCPAEFATYVHKWVSRFFKPLSIAFIVVCVVQLLCILFSCCLLCANREEYDPVYRQQQEQRRQAGDLTGVGPGYTDQGNNYV